MAGVDILATAFSGANAAFIADCTRSGWRTRIRGPEFRRIVRGAERRSASRADGCQRALPGRHGRLRSRNRNRRPAEGRQGGSGGDRPGPGGGASNSIRALMLIRVYRVRGHLEAKLDPLGLQKPKPHPELDPRNLRLQRCRFGPADLHRQRARPGDARPYARSSRSCGRPIAARSASSSCISRTRSRRPGSSADRGRAVAARLLRRRPRADPAPADRSRDFEAFCQRRYVGTKRFGLEGGESRSPRCTRSYARRRGRRERGRDRHAASRPSQHPRQRREEALKAVFSEFSGQVFKPDDVQGSAK